MAAIPPPAAGGSGASASGDMPASLARLGYKSRNEVYAAAKSFFAEERVLKNPKTCLSAIQSLVKTTHREDLDAKTQSLASQFFQVAFEASKTDDFDQSVQLKLQLDQIRKWFPDIELDLHRLDAGEALTVEIPFLSEKDPVKLSVPRAVFFASKLLHLLLPSSSHGAGAGSSTVELFLPPYCTKELFQAYLSLYTGHPTPPLSLSQQCALYQLCIYLQDTNAACKIQDDFFDGINACDSIEKCVDVIKTITAQIDNPLAALALIDAALSQLLSCYIKNPAHVSLAPLKKILEDAELLSKEEGKFSLHHFQLNLEFTESLITDEHVKEIKELFPNLQGLDLTDCPNISDKALEFLKGAPLTFLSLSDCKNITDAGLEHLQEMPLTFLSLRGCTAITDDGLAKLSPFKLTVLYLTECSQISNRGLQYLQGMPLKELYLTSCHKISDEGLAYLQEKRLTHLSVFGCDQITNLGLSYLRNMPLRELDVTHCVAITAEGLEHLKDMALRWLSLAYCTHLSNESLAYLSQMPLETLDLSSTLMTDEALPYIEALPVKRLVLRKCPRISKKAIDALKARKAITIESGA